MRYSLRKDPDSTLTINIPLGMHGTNDRIWLGMVTELSIGGVLDGNQKAGPDT